MPVRYSEHSSGPSTRRGGQYVEEPVSQFDYASLTKAELQAALDSRGLPKSGSKAELVARLEEADG